MLYDPLYPEPRPNRLTEPNVIPGCTPRRQFARLWIRLEATKYSLSLVFSPNLHSERATHLLRPNIAVRGGGDAALIDLGKQDTLRPLRSLTVRRSAL